ncbi:MAG: hypothetical protein OER21_03705 [Gemmatimonadota bacterium]|nr:hypothetical protein [Gemmatimonadota bacterium]
MLKRLATLVRAGILSVALLGLSGGVLWAEPSDCPQSAVGGQTGDPYELQSQSLVTQTSTITITAGGDCIGSGSTEMTISEQYHVGVYVNQNTDKMVRVDCRTGEVLKL